jgi:NAD(P)-dependent dehydrogenase (short-subunit alcohol dehydrogenase family)
MTLSGKSIIVAGGTSGIGLEAVLHFRNQGANVLAIGKDLPALPVSDKQIIFMQADLREADSIAKAIERCSDNFGGPHGLFHVAGGSGRSFGDGPLHEMTIDGWEKTFELNAGTMMLSNKAFINYCLERRQEGAIVNLSSALTSRPYPQYFSTHAYAAAKAAVEGLSLAAASHYAQYNIRINVISPGLTDTPMAKRALANELIMAKVRGKQQLQGGRAVLPMDIVPMAALLLSDLGSFITGQNIRIDGGWSVTEIQEHA